MPVKIRLTRRGRKKLALYDIIVADSRSPRDGKFIEKLGTFNPTVHPPLVKVDADKALKWVLDGAQPTDTVRNILSEKGVMLRKHLQVGVNKGSISQEIADKRFEEWNSMKENSKLSEADTLAGKKAVAREERLTAEAKVNAARKEAIDARNAAALAALTPPAVEEAPAAAEGEATDANTEATEDTSSSTDAPSEPNSEDKVTE